MRRIIIFCFSILILSACNDPKGGALSPEIRSELDELYENFHIETEEKYHRLANRMVQLLDEAIAKRTDELSMNHLREFYHENEIALDNLNKEIQDWIRNSPDEERTAFIMRVNSKSYASRLRNRRVQFLRKINYSEDYKSEFRKLYGILDLNR